MTKEAIGKQLYSIIAAYWTPERIELWHEYEKTDMSIPWNEYEHMHRNELVQSTAQRGKESDKI